MYMADSTVFQLLPEGAIFKLIPLSDSSTHVVWNGCEDRITTPVLICMTNELKS